MGNRRRPKRPDLNLANDAIHQRVLQLRADDGADLDEWTDEPAADYTPTTLQWIMAKLAADDQRVNSYVCEACGEVVVTIDKHPGATPAFVSHGMFGAECEGSTTSTWYRVRQEYAIYATHEWYRPSRTQLRLEDGPMRDHVERGGLMLRRIPKDSLTREEALLRLDMPHTNQVRLEVRGRKAGKARELAERRKARETGGYRG
jgi:hypothetical protein